ncbi:MAG: PDR/VanB family oxidoreductase [Steroidobacteraceae bacterium]
MRVAAIHQEALDVRSFELRSTDARPLPAHEPGAHIDLRLPGGIERSYSLLDPETDGRSYRIAVQRDPRSRGGSSYLFENVTVGDHLDVATPVNSFPLCQDAAPSVLIAGGIGITPIYSMVRRLEQQGRRWQLFYAARTRERAAFLAELSMLEQAGSGRVTLFFDAERSGAQLDIAAIAARCPSDAHLYCCGPVSMLAAFETATARIPEERRHVEYFAAANAPAAGGFDVELHRSGRVIRVPPGRSILDTLLESGMDLPRSCRSGVCGTCETTVIAGIPDHRDQVLSARERASNSKIMICCSGSLGEKLVLDL